MILSVGGPCPASKSLTAHLDRRSSPPGADPPVVRPATNSVSRCRRNVRERGNAEQITPSLVRKHQLRGCSITRSRAGERDNNRAVFLAGTTGGRELFTAALLALTAGPGSVTTRGSTPSALIVMTKSMSIIILLMAALFLGTIVSIHAQSQPIQQTISLDNTPGPHNPNQPTVDPAVRGGA